MDLVAVRTSELETSNWELEALRAQLELENEYLREEIFSPVRESPFMGRSTALSQVLQKIGSVASTSLPCA